MIPLLYDILLVFLLSAALSSLSTTAAILHLGTIKFQHSVTISETNLPEFHPKNWPSNLTSIDLSGKNLAGTIPTSIGNLLHLQNLSLASNSLIGPIPNSMEAMRELVHLDLSSNQLNGTVPKFISEIKNLKFLNIEKNKFHGTLQTGAASFTIILCRSSNPLGNGESDGNLLKEFLCQSPLRCTWPSHDSRCILEDFW